MASFHNASYSKSRGRKKFDGTLGCVASSQGTPTTVYTKFAVYVDGYDENGAYVQHRVEFDRDGAFWLIENMKRQLDSKL